MKRRSFIVLHLLRKRFVRWLSTLLWMLKQFSKLLSQRKFDVEYRTDLVVFYFCYSWSCVFSQPSVRKDSLLKKSKQTVCFFFRYCCCFLDEYWPTSKINLTRKRFTGKNMEKRVPKWRRECKVRVESEEKSAK